MTWTSLTLALNFSCMLLSSTLSTTICSSLREKSCKFCLLRSMFRLRSLDNSCVRDVYCFSCVARVHNVNYTSSQRHNYVNIVAWSPCVPHSRAASGRQVLESAPASVASSSSRTSQAVFKNITIKLSSPGSVFCKFVLSTSSVSAWLRPLRRSISFLREATWRVFSLSCSKVSLWLACSDVSYTEKKYYVTEKQGTCLRWSIRLPALWVRAP